MRSLRKLLGLDKMEEERDTASVRRIAEQLDSLPEDEARFLAAFAYVLARVARADLDVSSVETESMIKLIREGSHLTESQAVLVVTMAKTQALALGGTENYVVTRQFRDLSNRAQRIDLLRCLFSVAASDDDVSHVENTEITQIGTELGFTRAELAGVRQAYRDQLSVLKDFPS